MSNQLGWKSRPEALQNHLRQRGRVRVSAIGAHELIISSVASLVKHEPIAALVAQHQVEFVVRSTIPGLERLARQQLRSHAHDFAGQPDDQQVRPRAHDPGPHLVDILEGAS